MITEVAIKLNNYTFSFPKPFRHHHIIKMLVFLGEEELDGGIEGFLDDQGNFLDREQALQHAIVCNQYNSKRKSSLLFSEDLWQILLKPILKTNILGDKHWFLNGKLHREDGPAVEYVDGYKSWYLNGKFHREDGPAVEYENGDKQWFLNGLCHREDGPAIEFADGTKEWYLNGKEVTEDEYPQLVKLKVFW